MHRFIKSHIKYSLSLLVNMIVRSDIDEDNLVFKLIIVSIRLSLHCKQRGLEPRKQRNCTLKAKRRPILDWDVSDTYFGG